MSGSVSIVTGGAGFIGSHVADALAARGDRVIVVDDLSSGRRSQVPTAADFRQLDIRDADALLELAHETKPDCWFHFAAQADVRVSVEDPQRDAQVNVLGTLAVLAAAQANGARVVFASTGGAIYGADAPRPTPESEPAKPLSPYGAAKLAAEGYLGMHARLYGLEHSIMRFGNVYGPRQDPHGEAGVVAIFGGRLLDGETPTIYGDGEQTRDYVYVGDVVDATLATAGSSDAGVPLYNVGSGVPTSVNELLATMQRSVGTEIEAHHAPPREGELMHSCLDVSHARARLGIELSTTLTDGIAQTVEWMRSVRTAAGVSAG